MLLRTLILRRLLSRNVLRRDEEFVAILAAVGGRGLANAAVTLWRRVAVNLNYTVSPTIMIAASTSATCGTC